MATAFFVTAEDLAGLVLFLVLVLVVFDYSFLTYLTTIAEAATVKSAAMQMNTTLPRSILTGTPSL